MPITIPSDASSELQKALRQIEQRFKALEALENQAVNPSPTVLAAQIQALEARLAAQERGPQFSTEWLQMVASGAQHAPGLVPDTSATAGAILYLCEDGTWKLPVNGVCDESAFWMIEEFASGLNTGGAIGEHNWTVYSSGAAATIAQSAGTANHPGQQLITPITTNGIITTIYPQQGAYPLLGSNVDELVWIVNFSTGGTYDRRVGLCSSVTGSPPGSGIYFECLAADTYWYAVTGIAAVGETRTVTSVVRDGQDASGWLKFKIVRSGANRVFTITGATSDSKTNTTNIPSTTALMPFVQTVSKGAALTFTLDRMHVFGAVAR